jgi:hypoxanthine phosphoribosyltransferase
MTVEEAKKLLSESDVVATAAEIQAALTRMAESITERLAISRPIVCCIMNGGLIVAGQILTHLTFPLEVDYVHATRYGHETSGAEITWLVKPQTDPQGRSVLLLDDILDEGVTLFAIADEYRRLGAQEVLTAVLVDKQHDRKVTPGYAADFTGMVTEDRFLFGYGMDYRGYWRNAGQIYAVVTDIQDKGPRLE